MNTIIFWGMNTSLLFYLQNSHYGKQGLCRAPRAHGKGQKTHGKPFAVRFSSGRTAKGAR
jgi:hypothetical protein